MRKAVNLTLLLVAAMTLISIAPSPAFGCSCMIPDAEQLFADSDGVFVGTLVETPSAPGGFGPVSSADLVPYVFQVDAAYKGEITDPMTVLSAISGASCGLEMPEGTKVSVFLWTEGGEWHSGLCSTMGPEALLDGPFQQIPLAEAEPSQGTNIARWTLVGIGAVGGTAAGIAYLRRKPGQG